MATSNSSKKIQRVQQAGVTRRAGQRRPIGYGLAIAAIILVGFLLIYLARDSRVNAVAVAPEANRDHWHMAYGTYICDEYAANPSDVKADVGGIHAHGDGLIHVHPFTDGYAGKNATLGKFFDQVGIVAEDDSFSLATGEDAKAGDACGSGKDKTKKTEVKLFIWPPQAGDTTKPKIVTSDYANSRFIDDGSTYALALVPVGTKNIPLPPSVDSLANPSDAEPGAATPAPGDTPVTGSTGVTGDAGNTGVTGEPSAAGGTGVSGDVPTGASGAAADPAATDTPQG